MSHAALRQAAVAAAVALAVSLAVYLLARPAVQEAAGTGAWEYRVFLLVFAPASGPGQSDPGGPGAVAGQLRQITGEGWVPAGFQRDHARNVFTDWPSSHVLFKRPRR